MMAKSRLEDRFAGLWREFGDPDYDFHMEREFYPFKPRRFRFDFAIPAYLIAIEVHGGTFRRGRHVTGSGFGTDCEKRCLAVLNGWSVFELTGQMLRGIEGIEWVETIARFVRARAAIARRGQPEPS